MKFQAEVPAGLDPAHGRDSTRTRLGRLVQRLDQGTVRAVGLALAAMVANLIAVLFTVVFTRLLGADDYGNLATLLNVTVTLFVPGYALQVAVARAGTAGRMGGAGELSAALARWTRQLTVALVAVAALSVLLREQLAAALTSARHGPWRRCRPPPPAGCSCACSADSCRRQRRIAPSESAS